jgi:transposase
MPAKRLSIRKAKEILRLTKGHGLGVREAARSLSISSSTVTDCLGRAEVAGLGWPLDPDLDDAALEAKLYPPPAPSNQKRAMPDWTYVHKELRRKHVTLMLLWQEYKHDHPEDGYQYSQFCEHYKRFKSQIDVVMHQNHRAGEKTFVDYSGDGIGIVDRDTGEVKEASLFIAALGASSYTFAKAYPSQELPFWIRGHIDAYEFYEGVTKITVPDNPRTGVTDPCYYEPEIHKTYLDMSQHYNTVIIPARVRKPKDKAKVESGVLVAQRWILAALRNHTFFSIEQVNEAIAEKLVELNKRPFQKLDTTRRELFETLDKPALQPLPSSRYEFADWSKPKVNIDYHVEIDKHYYSVPYQLVHKRVEARFTSTTVEVFYKSRRVTSHRRSYVKGGYTTLKEHMPKSHQEYLEWTPSRILTWAQKTGPQTAQMAEKIMDSKRHPEQDYRACLGLLRMGKLYGTDRLEAACIRALAIGTYSYKSVKSILKSELDRQPLPDGKSRKKRTPITHDNIRGTDYYH